MTRCLPAVLLVASLAACSHPQSVQERIIVRAQSPTEAFNYLWYILGKMPFFDKHGYKVALTDHAAFKGLASDPEAFKKADKAKLKGIFEKEVYDDKDFVAGLKAIGDMTSLMDRVLTRLEPLREAWGFKVFDRYEVLLTMFGPGGSYDPAKGRITMLTTREGTFKRPMPDHTIVHETVHMGVEEVIVKRFRLEHKEKERLVDLICSRLLGDLLPGYQIQPFPADELDPFVTRETLKDLPAAMASYVKAYPR